MNISKTFSLAQSAEFLDAAEMALESYGVYALKVDATTYEIKQKNFLERMATLILPFFLKIIPPLFKRFSAYQSRLIESALDFHFNNVQTHVKTEIKNKYLQALEENKYKTISSIALSNIYRNWNAIIRDDRHSHNSTAYKLNLAWQDSHRFTDNERTDLDDILHSWLSYEKIKDNLSSLRPDALVRTLLNVINLPYKKLDLEQFSEAQILAIAQSPRIYDEFRTNCYNHLLKLHLRALATQPWPEEMVEDLRDISQEGTDHEWLKHYLSTNTNKEKITLPDLLNFIADLQKNSLVQQAEFKANLKLIFDKILQMLLENEHIYSLELADKVLEIIKNKNFPNSNSNSLSSTLPYLPTAYLIRMFCSSTDDLVVSDCFKMIVQKGNWNTTLEKHEPSIKMEFLSKFIYKAIATESAGALKQVFEIIKKEGLENLIRLNTFDFSFLLASNQLSDFELQLFVCPGNAKTIFVNSLILGTRNEFFQKLTGNFREGFDKKARLEVEDIESAEALVAHLYGKTLEINGENFLFLAALANQLGLVHLTGRFQDWYWFEHNGQLDLESLTSMVNFSKLYPELNLDPILLVNAKCLFLDLLNGDSPWNCIEILNLMSLNFFAQREFRRVVWTLTQVIVNKLFQANPNESHPTQKIVLLNLLNHLKGYNREIKTLSIHYWQKSQLALLNNVIFAFESLEKLDFSSCQHFEDALQMQLEENFLNIKFVFPPKPQPIRSNVENIDQDAHIQIQPGIHVRPSRNQKEKFLNEMYENFGVEFKSIKKFVKSIDLWIDNQTKLISDFVSSAMYTGMSVKNKNYLFLYEVLDDKVDLLEGADKELILNKMQQIMEKHHFRYGH